MIKLLDGDECNNWSVYSLTTEVINKQLEDVIEKEVVVKGLRVIANMSMNEHVGVRMSSDSELLKSLMQIITCQIGEFLLYLLNYCIFSHNI